MVSDNVNVDLEVNRSMRHSIALLVTALFASGASAADGARSHLDTFAKDLRAVSAHFEQQAFDPKGGAGKTSRGELALKAPRQFRWETAAPYKQLIVADGEKVWILSLIHISEPTRLLSISYAVFCLKKKN